MANQWHKFTQDSTEQQFLICGSELLFGGGLWEPPLENTAIYVMIQNTSKVKA